MARGSEFLALPVPGGVPPRLCLFLSVKLEGGKDNIIIPPAAPFCTLPPAWLCAQGCPMILFFQNPTP